jgi:transposase
MTAKELTLLSPELNPICYLLALIAHDFLHVSRIRVKARSLMICIAHPILFG